MKIIENYLDGKFAVPKDHPVTVLNPAPWKIEEMKIDYRGVILIRGDKSMWFRADQCFVNDLAECQTFMEFNIEQQQITKQEKRMKLNIENVKNMYFKCETDKEKWACNSVLKMLGVNSPYNWPCQSDGIYAYHFPYGRIKIRESHSLVFFSDPIFLPFDMKLVTFSEYLSVLMESPTSVKLTDDLTAVFYNNEVHIGNVVLPFEAISKLMEEKERYGNISKR